MTEVELAGCGATPLGSYLKALGVLRLVAEQADAGARGWWRNDRLVLQSALDEAGLLEFFLERYAPTPILAPWNGGSGFYAKDRRVGIDAIANSTSPRFAEYRDAIAILRALPEVQRGKYEGKDKNGEVERRVAIQRAFRNELGDRAVEWLDAAVGISASDERSFPPILGTGGNEGRLDYTNNFMERLTELLVRPDKKTPVRELLAGALFGRPTGGMRPDAAGQFDPGRAGGANQGQGVEDGGLTNPWDFVLTLEGAVAWSSGIYRRQGVSYRAILCSPFTVGPSNAGFGTAAGQNETRAEIWTPLWTRAATYRELQVLLREGRADVKGSPAKNGLQFAEAAISLGVDRAVERFVRYSLLMRRGQSYAAVNTGIIAVKAGYSEDADRVREMDDVYQSLEVPESAEPLGRAIESAMFELLMRGGAERTRALMGALGRLLQQMAATYKVALPRPKLDAGKWITACGEEQIEVRVAAALASIWDRENGSIREELTAGSKRFAWFGRDLPAKMVSVLKRRLLVAAAEENEGNPTGGAYEIHPGDATEFIEHRCDDDLIERLLFAFSCLQWAGFSNRTTRRGPGVLPEYALLKHLFWAGKIGGEEGESVRIRADGRVLPLLEAGRIGDACRVAEHRLRAAGLRPLRVDYQGGVEAERLAAALLIPVRGTRDLRDAAREFRAAVEQVSV